MTIIDVVGAYTEPELECLLSYVDCNDVVVEIGCLFGRSTINIANKMDCKGRLVAIDNFLQEHDQLDSFIRHAQEALGDNWTWIEIIQSASQQLRREHLPPVIDLAHIDGAHHWPNPYKDLVLVEGAEFIAVHDYENEGLPDVKRAVNEFLFNSTHEYEIVDWEESLVILG